MILINRLSNNATFFRCPETESGRLSGAVIKIGSVTLACQHGADHDAGKKLKLKLAVSKLFIPHNNDDLRLALCDQLIRPPVYCGCSDCNHSMITVHLLVSLS